MRYGQIIINFLTNAVKFSQQGGEVSVHLNVTSITDIEDKLSNDSDQLSAPDKEVRSEEYDSNASIVDKLVSFDVIFRDTGCGISPDNLKRLFKSFGKL